MKHKLSLLSALVLCALLVACQKPYTGRPTAHPTRNPTNTITPTATETPTPVPTATLTPSPTATSLPTSVPTATGTFTPTPIPTRLAELFPLKAGGITTVDWSYAYLTRNEKRDDGSQLNLSAMVAFRLLDRGIHSETVKIRGEVTTVYYLRVQHDFAGASKEVKLILTGIFGDNIALEAIPADGSSYIFYRSQKSDLPFQPANIVQDWALPSEQRASFFQSIRLQDFQKYLVDLPEKVILLADHPVILQMDSWQQTAIDMDRISASAARMNPLFTINRYNQMISQSPLATIWQNQLLNNSAVPASWEGSLSYSANYLVFITP